MLLAWLLALALGAAAGYLISQRGSRNYWQKLLDQQRAALEAELDAGKRQIQTLRQDNADLRYQLGEVEKAQRYLQDRNNRNADDTPI